MILRTPRIEFGQMIDPPPTSKTSISSGDVFILSIAIYSKNSNK